MTALPAPLRAEVEALRGAGRMADAARLCLARGFPAEAARLFESAWEFDEAVQAFVAAGRPVEALVAATRSRAPALVEHAVALCAATAASRSEALRRFEHDAAVAARLHEAGGELVDAARRWAEADDPGAAARCLEASGALRDAGRAYEAQLARAPHDEPAALGLGRVLARLGLHESLLRVLGPFARDGSVAALRLSIGSYVALGMDVAARSALETLRACDPSAEPTVEALVDALGAGARAPERDRVRGRYRVGSELGAGATGRVLLAFDELRDRPVALKLLHPPSGDGGRDALSRFAREAIATRAITHPNVIRVLDWDPDVPMLVLEPCLRGSLEQRLAVAEREGRALCIAEVRAIIAGVLDGLAAAHAASVVHRDLSPANVLFGELGEPKVGDFGTAHLVDAATTRTGALVGSVATMAPELVTGLEAPTPASDVYSVGCIAFRMLVGRSPFEGTDVPVQHVRGVPDAPSARRPALGTRFDAFVARALAKSPAERFASATVARDAWLAIDATEPDDDRLPARAAATVEPAQARARFVIVDALPGAALEHDVALDRWLERVWLDDEGLARVRAFAALDAPSLQAVFDVDPAGGFARLESPRGQRLSEARASRASVHAALAPLIDAFAEAGVVHGRIDPEHVVVGPHRIVLRLSLARPEAGRDDPVDLARLLATLA